MKSKAHIKSHPLHPILVTFPIAFFTGTFLLDLSGLLYDRNDFHAMAQYLEGAGIGFGLLAAIPGFIDFLYTIPPESSAKKRGARHGLLNVTMIILFAVALVLRNGEEPSFSVITALETVGIILLFISGWLGGTLVYRNQIGVDVRYAQAGKWKEQYLDKSNKPIEVAKSDELKLNQMKLLHIDGKRLVLCLTEKGYAVFNDRCTHKGGSLAGGSMICNTVQCPWHGSQFDVRDGLVKAGPAKENILAYNVTVSQGKVFLTLP
jgi:uncharacterized membrane protein/nitrite reductase/ring-hydroxylating ferredoxin subunit